MLDMKIIVLLVLLSLLSTKNVVIIGDSRMVDFAHRTLGIPYTGYAKNGLSSYIIGYNAGSFGGHKIKVIAQTGAGFPHFKDPEEKVTEAVHTILKSSESGTVVLMCLGVNHLVAEGTFQYYKSLAEHYRKLKFYATPVVGISKGFERTHTYITNKMIKQFNSDLKNKVRALGLKNFGYKDFLYNKDPTLIYNSDKGYITLNVETDAHDGLHFHKKEGEKLVSAMLTKI